MCYVSSATRIYDHHQYHHHHRTTMGQKCRHTSSLESEREGFVATGRYRRKYRWTHRYDDTLSQSEQVVISSVILEYRAATNTRQHRRTLSWLTADFNILTNNYFFNYFYMHIFFEIIKWLYFALTAVVGFFFLRGQTVLSPEQFVMIKTLIMPGYLVMCGIMIGYTLASIWIAKFDHNPAFVNQVSTK